MSDEPAFRMGVDWGQGESETVIGVVEVRDGAVHLVDVVHGRSGATERLAAAIARAVQATLTVQRLEAAIARAARAMRTTSKPLALTEYYLHLLDEYSVARAAAAAPVLELEVDRFSAKMIPQPRPPKLEPAADLPPWRGEQWRRDRRRR